MQWEFISSGNQTICQAPSLNYGKAEPFIYRITIKDGWYFCDQSDPELVTKHLRYAFRSIWDAMDAIIDQENQATNELCAKIKQSSRVWQMEQ